MIKLLSSFIKHTVVLLLAFAVFNMALPVVYDSPIIGIAMVGALFSVLGLVSGWVLFIIAGSINAAIFGVLGHFVDAGSEGAVVGGCLGLVLAWILSVPLDVYFLMNLYRWVEWFPAFDFWPAAAVAVVLFFVGLFTANYSTTTTTTETNTK